MIKDYSWKLFETTGDINSYMLYREARQINKTNEFKAEEQQRTNIISNG